MSNPTTLVESFNGSLGALTGAGAIRYNGGLWLEEGTTNWLRNPSLEANTTDWAGNASAAIARSSDWAEVGIYSLLTDTPNATFPEGCQASTANNINQAGGTSWALSATVQGAGTLNLFGILNYSDASSSTGASSNFAASTTPLRVSRVIAATAAKTISQILLRIRTASQQDVNFYTDAAQVENKPYATSYCDSTLGTGYTLNGDNTSTRAASSAAISPTGILAPGSGAIAFRITPTIETGLEECWGECGVKGAGTDHLRWGRDASTHPFVEWSANNAAYQRLTATETVDAGAQAFCYFGHDGTDIFLQIGSNALETDTRDAVEGDFSTGDLTLEASAGGVIYDEFATFDRVLTNYEIARLNAAPAWSLVTLAANTQTRRIRQQFQLRPY